jgi:hypothetical protein
MLENQIKTILNRYGAKIVTQLQKRLSDDQSNATGRAIKSLGYEIKEVQKRTKLNVRGKKYIFVIDSGRASGKKPPPISKIKRWINAKGIKPYKKKFKSKNLAFAISKSIGRKGTSWWAGRKGACTGLLRFVIEKNKQPLSNELLEVLAEDIERQIKETQKDVN